MSVSQVMAPVEVESESTMDATDVEALVELYRDAPLDAGPDWCDLTPALDSNRDGDDGLGGVRL